MRKSEAFLFVESTLRNPQTLRQCGVSKRQLKHIRQWMRHKGAEYARREAEEILKRQPSTGSAPCSDS